MNDRLPSTPSAAEPVRRLDAESDGFDAALAALTRIDAAQDADLPARVAAILAEVRTRGDAALIEYGARFDGLQVSDASALAIGPDELQAALDALPSPQRHALEVAAARIRTYHEHQRTDSWSFTESDGTRLGQRVLPLDRVGLYVPGGKAAYPSSVLMNAIPARVAGVAELVMMVPTPQGVRNPMVLAAAAVAGVDTVFTIGGAQAVGALAYGTRTVPAVDKIVGPGNAWVAEAKRQVFGVVGIDMIAGPSEILVLADGTGDPDWVAMDLFSQAEHDELAQSILLCPDAGFIDRVQESIARLLPTMPRAATIARSLRDRGALVKVRDMAHACEIANRIAPEHLEIFAHDASRWIDLIRHAGAVFVGPFASESLGDYCAGPNHVLPTMRTARFSSPLGVYDFQKRSSLIELSAEAADRLGSIAATLADAEGLAAHAQSARLRLATVRDAATTPQIPGPAQSARRAANAVEHAVGADIRTMQAYPVARADGLIKLDAMESPYSLPDELRGELGRRLAALQLNRYPVPDYRDLKAAIAQRMGIPVGFPVVLGNGSDELIAMLGLATATSGRAVLAPAPSFVMYEIFARQTGTPFVGVDLRPDFSLDGDAMLAAIRRHRPALVYLAYPNNPTGACFDDALIERILAAAPGLVVLDEAYEPFAQRSWMPRLPEFGNLVVMRTVSKIGLAGVRLGYLAAAPAITQELEKVRPPYNISVLDEACALFALEHADVLARQAAEVRGARPLLARTLASLPGVQVFDSATNFILARMPAADAVHAAMRERGVLVRNVGRMHPLLADCLRISVGTPSENDAMLAALAGALAEQAGAASRHSSPLRPS